jgi:formamidopyrimidine-DNA glycosylase
MPELPEVECLTRAVRRVVKNGTFVKAKFYREDLRGPIPIELFNKLLSKQPILAVERRSKYLMIKTKLGYGLVHLGMTGNLICQRYAKPQIDHTHAVFTIVTDEGEKVWLHYVDPRRFGRIDCIEGHEFASHKFFKDLGPEPLKTSNLGEYLFDKGKERKKPIKTFIMDNSIVVGVGNIYAAEALFKIGLNPTTPSCEVSKNTYLNLGKEIQITLKKAIKAGGTTFRDFKNVDGKPGYFAISLAVYNREGQPCTICKTEIECVKQSGRSTFYCPKCQK